MALGNWPKGLVEDIYDWEFEAYNEVASKVDQIFEVKAPTQGAYDQKTTAIGMGNLTQKSTADTSVTYRRPSEGFTAYAVYRDFDDGLELTKNEVEDFPMSKTRDLVQASVSSWGEARRRTEDTFAMTLFTKGGLTAGHDNFKNVVPGLLSQNTDGLAYDAKPFFNLTGNTRTSKGGGTYFNAKSGLALNVAGYADLYNLLTITNAKNERDEVIDIASMGEKILLHPPQLRDEAFQTLQSEYLPGTDYNDKNPWYNTCKPVESRYLSDQATTFYLGIAKKGITFYRRGKPEIRTFRNEDTGGYRATYRVRYGFMAWNWRFWTCANPSTS
jgi:hypothetical protein